MIKHSKVSAIPDGLNAALVQSSDWNEGHIFEPAVQGILYDPLGTGDITGLHVTGVLQDKLGDGIITPVRVQGIWNDPLGDGNIVGINVTGILADPDGDGNYTGIKVTGLWKDDGTGNITGVVVKGIHYDALGNNVITGLQVTGLLQDVAGDGTITGVRVTGLLSDRLGNGVITGVRAAGLLFDQAGDGNLTGVNVTGVPIKPVAGGPYVGVAAAAENQYLRRKITGGATEYEFGVIPPAAGFTPNVVGLLLDKTGSNTFTGVNVTGFPVNPIGDNNYVGVTSTGIGQYLRRNYNPDTVGYEFANTEKLVSTDFNFTIQSPANFVPGPLIVGVNSIQLNHNIPGVNTSSPGRHYLYLFDTVSGQHEVVPLTSVSTALKQIAFTCAFAHGAGNWRLSSATSGIQEAIHSVSGTGKGAHIYVPSGRHEIRQQIYVANASASNITVEGGGTRVTTLCRATVGSTVTPFFHYDSAGLGEMHFTLKSLKIAAGQVLDGSFITTTQAAINMQNCSNMVIADVEVTNGLGGLRLSAAVYVSLRNFIFTQEAAYTPIQASTYGIYCDLGCSSFVFDNCRLVGETPTHANYLVNGINIRGLTSSVISNCRIRAQTGISFDSQAGVVLNFVYVHNCLLSEISNLGIILTGSNGSAAFANIHVTNCRIIGAANNANNGILINGDADYLIFADNDISAFYLHGMFIEGKPNFQGTVRKSILISRNQFYNNGVVNVSETAAIRGTGPVTGLTITGNSFTERTPALTYYGIFFASLDQSVIIGNKFTGLVAKPILITAAGANLVIRSNHNVSDVVAFMAAGAVIDPGASEVVRIDDTTPITRILGGWEGRRLTIIFVNAAPGGLVAGGVTPGAIAKTATMAYGSSITLTYHFSFWW